MTKRSVKFILASLALIGFVGVTMFWSAGTHHGGDHNCISAALQNEVCPNASTPKAALFHLQTLQSFVSNGGQAWLFSGLLFALAFLALGSLVQFTGNLAPGPAVRRAETIPIFSSAGYKRWLSLLEHSPSNSPGRV